MFAVRLQWALMNNMISSDHTKILEGFFSSILDFKVKMVTMFPSQEVVEDFFNRAYLLKSDLEEYFLINFIYIGKKKSLSKNKITKSIFLEELNTHTKVSKIKIILSESSFLSYNETKMTSNFFFKKIDSKEENDVKFLELSSNTSVVEFPKLYVFQLIFFDNEINSPLDQWLYYLKYGEILKEFDAFGLREASVLLDLNEIDNKIKEKYKTYFKEVEKPIGIRGIIINKEKKIKKEILEKIAIDLLHNKVSLRVIENVTGLAKNKINSLKDNIFL